MARTKVITRRPRRRTRWYPINPGTRTFSVDSTWAANTLAPQVAVNEVPFGSTLLRVLVDIEITPSLVFTPGLDQSGYMLLHAGLFVAPDTAVGAIDWDPNFPHGPWMTRDNQSYWVRQTASGDLIHTSHRRVIRFDTEVKRTLEENAQLHMAFKYFHGGVVSSTAIGWTGRFLVALP